MQLLFFVSIMMPTVNDKLSNFVASENYSYTLVNQLGQEAQFPAVVCFALFCFSNVHK